MTTNATDNAAQRLRAILEVLAEPDTGKLSGNDVLTRVFERFPLDEIESELLSGNVPRGQKSLTTASAKLVKTGWLTKTRGGWSITEAGRQALNDFPDGPSFAKALGGTGRAQDTTAPDTAVQTFPQPTSVAVAGDFNTLMGCSEDWQPEDDRTQLALDPQDQLWKLSVDLPAGSYAYKAALNRSWDENYGAEGAANGSNITLVHDGGPVRFHYDHRTHVMGTIR